MPKTLQQRLEAETQDEELQSLIETVTGDVKRARRTIAKSYPLWDAHNDIYRGRKPSDLEDREASAKGQPKKMVVPMTYAQVNTFVAFAFLLFTQNRRVFEFFATGGEDVKLINDIEECLERDLRRNFFLKILFQSLLDTTRFGIGIVKSWWTVETQYVVVPATPSAVQADNFEFQTAGESSTVPVTKYEGNKLEAISPYNFFYDTRFPVSEWRKGSFVADETEWHINELKDWQRDSKAYGIEHIIPMDNRRYQDRGETRLKAFSKFMGNRRKDEADQIVCVTECHRRIVPKDYGLGEETHPTPYVITIANDSRIINVTPSGYIHDDWCYDVGLFSPDMHQDLAIGLADTIFAMQDVVSYLINSRLTSVRRSLEQNLVVDPSKIDMSTVENRSPYILTKKVAHNSRVSDYVHQLQYIDTTASHLGDADTIMKIMNIITGVNENAMGVVSSGRRSATELRAANGGAAARMKVVTKLIWTDQFANLGRKMQLNLRQGLSMESYVKILGPESLERYEAFHPPIQELVGVEDHFTFDATVESEKGYTAQSLQDLLQVMLSSPEIAATLSLDPSKIIEEVLELRGIDNIERFKHDQPPLGAIQPVQGGVPTGVPTQPPVI